MIKRIYTLGGDASHNIGYCLKNAFIHAVAYLCKSFICQSANYVGTYFPVVNDQYNRCLKILRIKLLPTIKFIPSVHTHNIHDIEFIRC